MREGIPLGREYLIDLDSMREGIMYNTDSDAIHTKTIVDSEDGTRLIFDLLELVVESSR